MPELNEIKTGKELGKTQKGSYIYYACSICGKPRWIQCFKIKKPKFRNICSENGCQQRERQRKLHESDPMYWNGKGELLVGMKCSSTNLRRLGYETSNKDSHSMLTWYECPNCKIQYWRESGRKFSPLCEDCSRQHNGLMNVKEKSGRWSGGRHMTKQGYVNITLYPDDPLFCMARQDHRVFEHKYVYAKFLGRPLNSWEVIHHKGTKYPRGSFEDKGDNRLENLEYCVTQANHLVYNMMQRQINELQARVTLIESENALLKAQLESNDLILK